MGAKQLSEWEEAKTLTNIQPDRPKDKNTDRKIIIRTGRAERESIKQTN